VQDLNALDEAGIKKLAGGVREVADVELVAQRYAVDEQGNPVAADTANVQALGTETLPGSFGLDPGRIKEYIANRQRQVLLDVVTVQHCDVSRNVTEASFRLVRDDDDFID